MDPLLANVFEHTRAMVEKGIIKTNSHTAKHTLDEISNDDKGKTAIVKTINADTVSVALEFIKLGKTAILNMASARIPGGGVVNGARAQEECLFRCSNLFEISHEFYPLKVEDALYTNDAVFFKNREYRMIEPFTLDVITIAAVNLNKTAKSNNLNEDNITENYEAIMKDKIRMMFDLASKNDCVNIILGAWGCGVFKNEPENVARFFDEVIKENAHKNFDNIIFAVINDHNSVANNYDIFEKHFNS